MRPRKDMRDYQAFLSKLIVDTPASLLALPMSMGKTVTSLTAARKLLDYFEATKVLVVAPIRVARDTWPNELGEWEHLKDTTYTLIRAEDDDEDVVAAHDVVRKECKFKNKERVSFLQKELTRIKREKRQRLAGEDTEIHIINREAIPWLVEHFGKNWPYDMVIYDESSRFKSGKKRTAGGKEGSKLSEFGALCSVRKYISRIVELSGTPNPNGLHELWGQIYLLDLGQRLGRSRTAFETRWFDKDHMGWNLTPKPNAHAEIMDAVKDVMFGLRAEDYLKLPPVVPLNITVRMSDAQMRDYRAFEKSLYSQANDVLAVSRGVLSNKCLQYANGGMYRKPEGALKSEVIHIHDLKIDALESLIEESNGDNILCAYSFKFDLARLRKRFKFAKVFDEMPDAVAQWNARKIKLLLAHPANIGHGLNLQYGGATAVWFGLTHSRELYDQFNARLPRPGQPSEFVRLYHILTEGTADEDAMGNLKIKGEGLQSVNDAIRLRILRS